MVMSLTVSIVKLQFTPAIEPRAKKLNDAPNLYTLAGALRVSPADFAPQDRLVVVSRRRWERLQEVCYPLVWDSLSGNAQSVHMTNI